MISDTAILNQTQDTCKKQHLKWQFSKGGAPPYGLKKLAYNIKY